jgi:retinol dehydrogenase-12
MESDLCGKVFLVTGASTGIGRVTAEELARRGGHVILAGRSEARTGPVVEAIRRSTSNSKVEFLHVDLSDLGSVRGAAAAFLSRGLPLHVLVNNAGLAGVRGLTPGGFELTFGTNHLGPFLLTLLLLDRLKESPHSRSTGMRSSVRPSRRAASTSTRCRSSPTCSSRRSWPGGWPAAA